MTPEEKAKELIDRFYEPASQHDFNPQIGWILNESETFRAAKACAIICVEEILKATESVGDGSLVVDNEWTTIKEYWQSVKKSIKEKDI